MSAKFILIPLTASGLIQLLLSLLQLTNKHSIQGLFYFLGERYFNLSTPGIAQASFSGIEFLRPYGTFSHPNSLAGFYLLLYFFILTNKKMGAVGALGAIKNIFLLTAGILVFLSFSKTAIITFLILNTFYLILSVKNCRLCLFARIFVLIIVSLTFLLAQTDPLTLQKRADLLKNSFIIIGRSSVLGVGVGSYLIAQNKLPQFFLTTVNQPVHNIFLLFFSEWGLTSAGLVLLAWKWLRIQFKKNPYLFLVIIFTGFFDHYWLTLIQNFLLLAVVFAGL